MPVESACPATVLADHLFGLFGLTLVMGGLGLVVVLPGLLLLLFHHPFGLSHRPSRAVGGTRGGQQKRHKHQRNSDSFHRPGDYRHTKIRYFAKNK